MGSRPGVMGPLVSQSFLKDTASATKSLTSFTSSFLNLAWYLFSFSETSDCSFLSFFHA